MSFPSRKLATLTGHNGPVHCVTFSAGAGQYILTGASDRTVRLFNPAKATSNPTPSSANPTTTQSPALIQSYSAHGYEILDLAVSSDNSRFASVGGDKQVFLWDVAAGKTLRRYAGHNARVNAVAFGGEGDSVVVSGSFDATLRIWDTKSQSHKPIQTFDEARDSISSIIISDHEIISGSLDGRVRTYDLRMGMMYTDVIGEAITSLSQSLDSATILVSSLAAPLRLLDKTSGKVLQSYAGHENKSYRLRSCLGLRDTIAISGSENGSIFAWDLVEGGEPIEKIEEPHKGKVISAVAWNGRAKGGEKDKALWASAGGDGTVCVWGMS